MVVGDISTGTDVLVIGAGPGGYVAAIRAAQHDLDVTLVEKDAYGGTCLNTGCIPSKALISATDLAERAGDAEEMGVYADPAIDLAGTQEWKDGVVDTLTGGVEKLCKANGVNLIEGQARFDGPNSVRVAHGGEGQGSESIDFEHAIVATGSRPIQIPGFDFADEPVWSSTDALAAGSVPEDLVVVGAGYIGMELSTVYAKLGADVTVVEMLDSVLPLYEDDLGRVVRDRAGELGIEFHFGEGATQWRAVEGVEGEAAGAADGGDPEGAVDADAEIETGADVETDTPARIEVVTETEDGEESTYEADRVLVAVGRQPVTDTLDLGEAGIEPDEDGFVPTDDRGRTEVDHIYAIGDVAGEPMLAHKASKEGEVVAEHVAGEPVAMDYQAVPAAVFTDPEIATVGMAEAEAEEAGFDVAVGQMPFNASGRALTTGEQDGFVRVVADADAGFVLGAQIVGPEASELIAEPALAIEMGATLEDVGSTVHTHPTLAEAVMEAVENARGQAIHTLNR